MELQKEKFTAKWLSEQLLPVYEAKYPNHKYRVSRELYEAALFQHVSCIDFGPRMSEKQRLLDEFRTLFPGIEHARSICWIDLSTEMLTLLEIEGSWWQVYGKSLADFSPRNLKHQLFEMLPECSEGSARIPATLEFVSSLIEELGSFYSVQSDVFGEADLFQLLLSDVSAILRSAEDLGECQRVCDMYLKLYAEAVLDRTNSDDTCRWLAERLVAVRRTVVF